MNCSFCNSGQTKVYKTDSSRESMVVRYRKCLKCGNNMVTVEILKTDIPYKDIVSNKKEC